MKHIILIFLLVVCAGTHAQVFPVQVNPQLTPPYSPYLSDYTAPGSQDFMVQIRTNDLTLTNYPCKLSITIEGVGITISTKQNFVTRPLVLEGGGVPQIFYGEDLWEYFQPGALDFSGHTRSEYEKRARLPEGVYRFTVEVLDYNRGTVVSNRGMTMAWIILSDPPMLNLPTNFAKIKLQDPTNILFSWTPRHSGSPNAAFTTEYIFRLLEIWPENRNPYDAFLTQLPLYESATTQNQILYGLSEPALIPGRKYAWQVQARDTGGKDLFKNNGRSEVFVFQFGDALAVPENLQLRWAKPTTLAIRWDPITGDGEEIRYRLQYRPRKRQENHQWYQTRTKFTEKTLYNLQTDTEYEARVRAEKIAQQSEYTEILIFNTLPHAKDEFVCRDNAMPPPLPANTLPVFPLSVNDTIHAGGYEVLVRDVIEMDGKYYGSGLAIVPWLNAAKVRVTFEKIGVNDLFWLTSGTIKSVWNTDSEFLIESEIPIAPGNVPQAGELDVTIVAADSLISVAGTVIAAVTKDEEGNIVVTTTDGRQQTLSKGESYAIVDEAGNGYVVDKKGNIAKTTATVATAAAGRGNRNYNLTFRFVRGAGRFGFDEKKYDGLSQYYQQLDDGTFVPWKALSSSSPDAVEGLLQSGDTDISSIRFETGSSTLIPESSQPGKVRLNLQGKAGGVEEELLARYSLADTLPEQVLGKLNLVSYNPIQYNLEIVPVNNAALPGLTVETIAERLNAVYRQAVVEWKVSVAGKIQVALGETFDEGEKGVFSNYTSDMKKVLTAFGRFQDNTYYLFLIDEPKDPSTLGYMPRNRQAGFIFIGPHHGNSEQFLKTIAHELGHGAFNLKHIFNEHHLPAGATDNVMDYTPGTALYKYQWDYIHEPQRVIGLFEGDEGGMRDTFALFESAFIKKVGGEFQDHDCWDEAIERGFEVYNRFDFEIALYAGFLRLMLCATEKENCQSVNYQAAFTCGFTNALLQELDWITILESIEGISIDPEEILLCIHDSFPIGGSRDDNLRLDAVVFRCLVGFEIKDLTAAIKDFITTNWDEPYYQGQASAFALTLLTPFKGKILTKMEDLPQYAGKMDNFRSLSKAGNSDELVEISKGLVNDNAGDLAAASRKANISQNGVDLPIPVGKFRQLVGKNNKSFRAADFWKQSNPGYKTFTSSDGRYLIKHDPASGRMLFADVENKQFIGFALDEEDLIGNDYEKLLKNLKTVHGLPGGEKYLKINDSSIPLSGDKANIFLGRYNPNNVPGINGEIGTDDIIRELSILKNYSFADEVFQLRAGSVNVLNIPEQMGGRTDDFFDAYNKDFMDMIVRNKDRVNVVFVSDPRKINLLRVFRNGIPTDDPSGFAKEIKYLNDRAVNKVILRDGTTIDLSEINLMEFNWANWEY